MDDLADQYPRHSILSRVGKAARERNLKNGRYPKLCFRGSKRGRERPFENQDSASAFSSLTGIISCPSKSPRSGFLSVVLLTHADFDGHYDCLVCQTSEGIIFGGCCPSVFLLIALQLATGDSYNSRQDLPYPTQLKRTADKNPITLTSQLWLGKVFKLGGERELKLSSRRNRHQAVKYEREG